MAGGVARLAVEMAERGTAEVAGGLDDVTSSAKRMGDATDAASRQAKTAGDRMDSVAGSADEMASKGSQAAGAMAGLGDLIGGPFGGAMQVGGIGLQAMADSGDLLNAALENSVVQSLRAKAATATKTVIDKAATVATYAQTIAQRALNAAMRANPVGLIIAGITILIGLIILAYKRSDTFRSIVQKAMAIARAGVDKVVKGFQALAPVVGKVMAFVGRIVGVYVKVYVTAFQLSLRAVKLVWSGIQAAVKAVVDKVTSMVGDLRDKLAGAWKAIKTAGKAAFDAIKKPVQDLIDLVQKLIDKITNIHIPGGGLIGKLNPFDNGGNNLLATAAGPSRTTVIAPTQTVTIPVTFTGTGTPADADAFMARIDQRLRALGKPAVFS